MLHTRHNVAIPTEVYLSCREIFSACVTSTGLDIDTLSSAMPHYGLSGEYMLLVIVPQSDCQANGGPDE